MKIIKLNNIKEIKEIYERCNVEDTYLIFHRNSKDYKIEEIKFTNIDDLFTKLKKCGFVQIKMLQRKNEIIMTAENKKYSFTHSLVLNN